MAARGNGSNLFSIDRDAIRTILADANQKLVERKNTLIAAFQRAPVVLGSSEDISRAQRFVEQLEAVSKEVRSAKLADGKPFRQATDTVKAFFNEIDDPIRMALNEMKGRLTQAAMESRKTLPATQETEVITAYDGSHIITRVPSTGQGDRHEEIPLKHVVQGFDRDRIDLNQLRAYLTDASILAACKKHLSAAGPTLQGVTYEEIAE